MSTEKLLISKNIRPSLHRVMIYDYIKSHRTHPTVDDIFSELHKTASTLSKTTVYNTLELFYESGIVKKVSIEGNVIHYDACTDSHGHFLCRKCNKIYDFDINSISSSLDEAFITEVKELYYYGICKNCRDKN